MYHVTLNENGHTIGEVVTFAPSGIYRYADLERCQVNMTQQQVRDMVGNQITKSMNLPADIRFPKNAPAINASMEDAFTLAYYNTDKRMDDK